MTGSSDPRLVKRFAAFATVSAGFSIAVGLSGLAGWKLQIVALTTWGAAPITMKPTTSACFVLTGLSLSLVRKAGKPSFAWARTTAGRIAAAVVLLISSFNLLTSAFRWGFGTPPPFLAGPSTVVVAAMRPGPMSPLTAAAFLSIGVALMGFDWRTRNGRSPVQMLALFAGAIATFGLFSFATDPRIYAAHLSLSLPTAVTLLAVFLGIISARTESSLGALLCSPSMGGILARRLLPAAFIPAIVGCLRWQVSRTGLSEWNAEVLAALTCMFLLAGIVGRVAMVVNRNEVEQRYLEEARERLAALVDSSDDAIVSVTLLGRITGWNSGAERLFGYAASEVVDKTAPMLLPLGHVAEEIEIASRIGQGERVYHFETVRVRKDGQHLDVSVTVSPIRDKTGAIVGASHISRDITGRKQTEATLAAQAETLARSEQALRTQTTLFQSVLDNINEGLVAADEHGHYVLWNPAAEKILGIGSGGLSISEWQQKHGFFLPDTVTRLPADQSPLAKALRGESSTAELFVRQSRPGKGVFVEFSAHPMRDANGTPRGGVVAFWDITQRKATEQAIQKWNEELEQRVLDRTAQLAEAQREMETFTYSIAHDLRTPLRHIAGYSAIMMEEFGPAMDANALRYLERVREGASRMGQLVDELLGLAQVGRQETRMRSVDLHSIVQEVIGTLGQDMDGRQVEWKIAHLPVVECDPKLIKLVFLNLISNALKYSRPRALAVIEIGETEGGAIFIRDNGVGFNMKYVDKVFRLFQRLHSAEDFEGTGVGLATVQRIIKKHKGTVWAYAEPEQGATFYFTIGRTQAAASQYADTLLTAEEAAEKSHERKGTG